jgi:hypothetical protein
MLECDGIDWCTRREEKKFMRRRPEIFGESERIPGYRPF